MSIFTFKSVNKATDRPGTASLNRPGTSQGRKNLATSNSTSNQAPDITIETNDSIIKREIANDDLLRIMSADRLNVSNQVIMYAESGNLEKLRALHLAGLDIVNCRGLNGFTPLHHACNRAHALVVAELLRLKSHIDCKNDMGETPLHLAVYAGNILIVDQLLDFGADINAANHDGETSLFYAARRSQPAVVRLLLQRGASTDVRDRYEETAVEHAADDHTRKAFVQFKALVQQYSDPLYDSEQPQTATTAVVSSSSLKYSDLLHVFSFLNVMDVLRGACVCSKWHRVSEFEEIWTRLGVRRWELALQSSLGFAPSATTSFFRPSRNRRSSNSSSSSSSSSSSYKLKKSASITCSGITSRGSEKVVHDTVLRSQSDITGLGTHRIATSSANQEVDSGDSRSSSKDRNTGGGKGANPNTNTNTNSIPGIINDGNNIDRSANFNVSINRPRVDF